MLGVILGLAPPTTSMVGVKVPSHRPRPWPLTPLGGALAYFPTDNSSTLDVGLFLQTMNASGGDGVIGLVGYILKFV